MDIDRLDIHAPIRGFFVYQLFYGIGDFNGLGEHGIHFGVANDVPQGSSTRIILPRRHSTKKTRMPI
jgi:hypothetical protein